MEFPRASSRRPAAADFWINENDPGRVYASKLVRHVQVQMNIDGEFARAEQSTENPHPELHGIPACESTTPDSYFCPALKPETRREFNRPVGLSKPQTVSTPFKRSKKLGPTFSIHATARTKILDIKLTPPVTMSTRSIKFLSQPIGKLRAGVAASKVVNGVDGLWRDDDTVFECVEGDFVTLMFLWPAGEGVAQKTKHIKIRCEHGRMNRYTLAAMVSFEYARMIDETGAIVINEKDVMRCTLDNVRLLAVDEVEEGMWRPRVKLCLDLDEDAKDEDDEMMKF